MKTVLACGYNFYVEYSYSNHYFHTKCLETAILAEKILKISNELFGKNVDSIADALFEEPEVDEYDVVSEIVYDLGLASHYGYINRVYKYEIVHSDITIEMGTIKDLDSEFRH